MAIFLTGGTGYLGGYAAAALLRETDERLLFLVRAADDRQALAKTWRSLQLHFSADAFEKLLPRIEFVLGDLEAPALGLVAATRTRVLRESDSVLHVAASLNRKSERACTAANVRGTQAVALLARDLGERGRLRRYTQVSTTAVAGVRHHETVTEDDAIDWQRPDYDPYGRTKKVAEHLARELLAGCSTVVVRPSIVIGDPKKTATTQFDMLKAFALLARLPVLPVDPQARLDIVDARFVGTAIARLHVKPVLAHDTYHLSAGNSASTVGQLAEAMARGLGKGEPRFVPWFAPIIGPSARVLGNLRTKHPARRVAALVHVFWPYITDDTVFANDRVVRELGIAPTPFLEYCVAAHQYATRVGFSYPYEPLPARWGRASNRTDARAP